MSWEPHLREVKVCQVLNLEEGVLTPTTLALGPVGLVSGPHTRALGLVLALIQWCITPGAVTTKKAPERWALCNVCAASRYELIGDLLVQSRNRSCVQSSRESCGTFDLSC